MNEEMWAAIREAVDKVADGMRRVDYNTADADISVYKVGTIIRCDIKPPNTK